MTVAAVSAFIAVTSATACNVPVFRYALERWPADPYRIVVFLDGESNAKDAEALDLLESSAGNRPSGANAIVKTVDISGGVPVQWQKLYDSMKYTTPPGRSSKMTSFPWITRQSNGD